MTRWFRFYSEALDDPKVQRLDGDTFKAWINILCIANQNDGFLPVGDDLAFALRIDANAARTVVERLLNAGLIDKLTGGANGYRYAPHGWNERQYKSDTSTGRVKRFRERSKPVTVTPPDTEAETEVTLSKDNGAANAAVEDSDAQFWDTAKSYLRGESKNPGALIGKWCRDHGKDATSSALTRAQLERPVQRIPFIEGVFKHSTSSADEWAMMP